MNWIYGFLIIIGILFIYKANGQCDSNLKSYCSVPDNVKSILYIKMTSEDYITACSSYNETCYNAINKCASNSTNSEDMEKFNSYAVFKYVCSDTGKKGVTQFQNCLINNTFHIDGVKCFGSVDILDPCLWVKKSLYCGLNTSIICNSSTFVCDYVTLLMKDNIVFCNITIDCHKEETPIVNNNNNDKIVVSFIIIGSLLIVIITSVLTLVWANRRIKSIKEEEKNVVKEKRRSNK